MHAAASMGQFFESNRSILKLMKSAGVVICVSQLLIGAAVKSEAKSVTFSISGTVTNGGSYDSSLVQGALFNASFTYSLGIADTSNSPILGYYDFTNTPYSVSAKIGDLSISQGTFREVVYNNLGNPPFDQLQFDSFGDLITSPDPSFQQLSSPQFTISFRDYTGTLLSSNAETDSSILNSKLVTDPNINAGFILADFPNGGYRYISGTINSISIASVPEPGYGALTLVGLASSGLLVAARRRKKSFESCN